MQPEMPSIRDCKPAVVPKPHRNLLEEYFPAHNTSTAPLKLSLHSHTDKEAQSWGKNQSESHEKQQNKTNFLEEENGVKGLHFLF